MGRLFRSLVAVSIFLFSFSGGVNAAADNPIVQLQTNFGDITLQLNSDDAPLTVDNFMDYVETGFYDNTVFHRVIEGFMIQGGGYDTFYEPKVTAGTLVNEAHHRLSNLRGTISMARGTHAHSATSQFFINQVDNPHLDYTFPDTAGWGYAVFGEVIDGMEVVDWIAAVETGRAYGLVDVPLQDVIVYYAKVVAENGDATFNAETATLHLPAVEVLGKIYEAYLTYEGGATFALTSIQELDEDFDYDQVSYDAATGILHLDRVEVGEATYAVDFTYMGGNQLMLTHFE